MSKFLVVLVDGTVGVADSLHEEIIGQLFAVELHDENGNKVQIIGEVAEVLEEVAA
jgi:hypothetical protein